MTPETFNVLMAEGDSKHYTVDFKKLKYEDLQQGDVTVRVSYSSLNYKDGLAVTGKGKIIRKFPMVCGIDLAGEVIESKSPEYKPGDAVLVVGQNLSETLWGGYAQVQRVASESIVRIPKPLDAYSAMAIGTAGFTAMLCLLALEKHNIDRSREVVVTGASGGVGSMAVLLLSHAGYRVVASTGRKELERYLRDLGASALISREELAKPAAPLQSERWGGAIDSVGGATLANILASTAAYGAVACCGLAGGAELHTTVFPFILRNVSLLGIFSGTTPRELREEAWSRLASGVSADVLSKISRKEPLSRIKELSEQILAGQVQGRVVIDVNA